MRKFTIDSSKKILDLNGQPFIIRGVTYLDYLFCSYEVRSNQSIRALAPPSGYTIPTPPASMPTFAEPEIYRDETFIAAQLDRMCDMGINTIRVAFDPAMPNTAGYTHPTTGVYYPGNMEILDKVIELAGLKQMLVILTGGRHTIDDAAHIATVTYFANRYKYNPWVAINPKNEINCEAGNGACATAATWVADQAAYVSAIRGTGFEGLIVLNPLNWGHTLLGLTASIAANSTLANDGGIAYGIHSYKRAYPIDTDFASRIAYETSDWYAFATSYCVFIEEAGISNFVGTQDPDLDYGVPSSDLAEWVRMVAYVKDECDWWVEKCGENLNGAIACRWSTYFPSISKHDPNSLVRTDGSLTAWGNVFKEHFLDPMRGVVVPPSTPWTTVFSSAVSSQGSLDFNAYNVRMILPANSMSASAPTKMRFTLKSPPSATPHIAALYVGEQAASGDIQDFAATPTQVTFNGGSSTLIMSAGGAQYVSDPVTIVLDHTKANIFSYAFNGSNSYSSYSGLTGANMSLKAAGASGVATVNVTGFTPNANLWAFISKIEVQ